MQPPNCSRHRLVGQQDIPIAESPLLRQVQGKLAFDAVEHRPPLAKNDGAHHDLVFIDQTLLNPAEQ